ncbi:hypothetical protein LZ017_09320 [Pelomonas sp. CA6]|uniref:hypothetical protein n=1 Tax=Pelomonas sp. CA6 TaxID=2907999 RepID=UPI001F4BE4DE|nr:hypothetical protein [Pelomonas sp. CA6]MCH7343576.1 hypothetical protein [Pelomonas sp. CA6]
MSPEVTNLRQRLEAAANEPRKKELVDIARSLEYASLEFEHLPEEIFSIYTDALSNPLLCAAPGADEFITGLFNDFEKLSPQQQEGLKALFLDHGNLFTHPMLRISVGDLIARKFSGNVALALFSSMWIAGSEPLRDIAYSGAQVLSRLFPASGQNRDGLRKLGELMKTGATNTK